MVKIFVKGTTADLVTAASKFDITVEQASGKNLGIYVPAITSPYLAQPMAWALVPESDVEKLGRWYSDVTQADLKPGVGYPVGTLLHYAFLKESE